jgi:hypothetical protein
MNKAEKIKAEIEELQNNIINKNVEMLKLCHHKNIEWDNWCSDDWAFPNWYTNSYECGVCGLYVSDTSHPNNHHEKIEVSEDFKKLHNIYWKNESQYRIDNFDDTYKIKKSD